MIFFTNTEWQSPVEKTAGLFVFNTKNEMKFLFVILTIRFLFSLLDNAGKKKAVEPDVDNNVKHPAEFDLR
jgi:hypothetical protein